MNPRPTDSSASGSREPRQAASTRVPDLIGLGIADACEAAAWAGTSISTTSVARPQGPWGVIVAQSPSPGLRPPGRWRIHALVTVPPQDERGPGSRPKPSGGHR